jgi:hypothetical protein
MHRWLRLNHSLIQGLQLLHLPAGNELQAIIHRTSLLLLLLVVLLVLLLLSLLPAYLERCEVPCGAAAVYCLHIQVPILVTTHILQKQQPGYLYFFDRFKTCRSHNEKVLV